MELNSSVRDENPENSYLNEAVFQRRKGLRRLKMSFDYQNQLVVGVPWNCSMRSAREFVESNRDWVRGQMTSLAPVLSLEEYFLHHPFVSLHGRRVSVSIRHAAAGRCAWLYDNSRNEGLFHLGREGSGRSGLERVVRKVADNGLRARVEELASLHGFRPAGVTVRDQKSRWGSCSARGMISLNWRLLLFSPGVQDHVILHELAHLRYLNHSPRFHRLLSDLDPRRAEHEAELDRDGPTLMRVGRADERERL